MSDHLLATLTPLLAFMDLFDNLRTFFMLALCGGVAALFVYVIFKGIQSTTKSGEQDTISVLTQRVYDLERRMLKLQQQVNEQSQSTAKQAPPATPAIATGETAAQTQDRTQYNAQAKADAASKSDATEKPAEPGEPAQQLESAESVQAVPLTPPTPTPVTSNVFVDISELNKKSPAKQPMGAGNFANAASAPKPAAPKTSVEERLGTGVFIWVGGISLVLAGAFLVKYSFDNNLITPLMRVVLGVIFGLCLLAAAQYMHNKSRKIASALAGASVADLFACLLAANSLYHLIGSKTAFVLMIAVTGMAILLSLRHGRLVAVLGLIGGFVTPAIISEGNQQVGPLLAYLMLLQVAMTLVSRRRAWVGMTAFTLFGSLAWVVLLMFQGVSDNHRYMLELFLIAGGALYVLSASRMAAHETETKQDSQLDSFKVALSSLSAAAVLIGVLVYQGRFGMMDFAMLGLLGVALLILARLRPAYRVMAGLAGVVTLCTLMAWVIKSQGFGQELPFKPFWVTTLCFGLLYAVGSYIAMWRSRDELQWAGGSAAAGIAFFLLAKVGLEQVDSPSAIDILPWLSDRYDWAAIAGVLGVVYALVSYPVLRARLLYLQGNSALGVLVSTSAIFIGMAAHFALDFPWQLSVWATEAAILAWLVRWQRIAGIRTVAVAMGLLATLFMIVPGTAKIVYSQLLIFNAILPAYALPAIALGLAAWLLRAKRDAKAGSILRLLAIILGAAGSLALVRHGYHPANLAQGHVTLYEWATYSVVALTLGHGLLVWQRQCPGWPQQTMAILLLLLGVVDVIAGAGFIANPLWNAHSVGSWPVLNGLLFIYGAPAILIALLLWNRPQTGDENIQAILPGLIGSLTLLVVFTLVSLQVRQYFHHPLLNTGGVSNPEMYSYSVAWILLGILLVAIGIRFKSKSMRYASLVVMLIAIGKVFLLDTAHLEDLYRVISFLGLGVTLMVLGYVYQRFVFKRSPVEM